MKNYLTFVLLFIFLKNGFCKTNHKSEIKTAVYEIRIDSLTEYLGKFQKNFNGTVFYISFSLEDKELVGTQLWDNQKMALKHLSGDNFIVSGLDWSVKFIRDKEGKVIQVVVMGKDAWTKVKS